MSVLETFVRIRRYRARAAEFRQLAAGSVGSDVQDRYLAIADHYVRLADAEVRSDKMRTKERLAELRSQRERQKALARQPQVSANHDAPPRVPQTVRLRVIQGTGFAADEPGADRRSDFVAILERRPTALGRARDLHG